ncbi:MAG: hypothetical protein AB8C13_03395 [Phycisphaerales bacterium]
MYKIISLLVLAVSMPSFGSLTDFLIMSSDGEMLRVDGTTLNATHVADLDIRGTTLQKIELEYVSDSQIYLTHTEGLSVYNSVELTLETVFTQQNIRDIPGIYFHPIAGLAQSADGKILTTIRGLEIGQGPFAAGITTDPKNNNWELTSPHIHLQYSLDAHRIGEGRYFAIDGDHSLHIINEGADESEAAYANYFKDFYYPVSIFESDGSMFMIDTSGEIYSFDPDTGISERYGQINGVDGLYLLAATAVPAPSSATCLAFACLLGTKRRR